MSRAPERIEVCACRDGHFWCTVDFPDLPANIDPEFYGVKYVHEDLYEELEAKLARSERRNEALEELRPVWAQGWTDDSQAAQGSSNALAQLWEMLGASNQTQAVEALAKLKGDK